MTQQYAALEIDGQVNGNDVTGRFEFGFGERGRAHAREEVRTSYMLNSAFDDTSAIFTDLLSWLDLAEDGSDRGGVHLDLGGGEHVFSFRARAPADTTKEDGSLYQWGANDTLDDPPTPASATGVNDPHVQKNVLMRYFTTTKTHSFRPGRLYYGEYTHDGLYEPVMVVVENPQATIRNDSGKVLDLDITVVETRTVDGLIDAFSRSDA